MKEKTIQQDVFREIRKRDGITYADIAQSIGISEDGVFARMRGDTGISNFVQMLKACGYDINITKAPDYREAGVFFGIAGCDGCKYKNSILEIRGIAEETMSEKEEAIKLDIGG